MVDVDARKAGRFDHRRQVSLAEPQNNLRKPTPTLPFVGNGSQMGLVVDTSAADIAAALDQVGSRLKRLRIQRWATSLGRRRRAIHASSSSLTG
jgi:hypothetical protein